MSTIERSGRRALHRHSTEDVEAALQLVALHRGSTTTVAEKTKIHRTTLDYWIKDKYADRYAQIRNEIVPKIQAELAAKHEDMARMALDKQAEAFALMDLEQLKQPDLVKAARDLSVTSAVHTDKTQLLRDRPTAITEHRDTAQILDAIARKFPSGVVEGEAEDITDAEEA